jgi:hypothetical protein
MRLAFSFLTVLLALTISSGAFAKDVISHKPFNDILKTYVSKGKIDYAGLKANDADFKKFEAYVDAVAQAKVDGTNDAKLAFYLNAYNATVMKAVIERLPLESVMKVDGFFNKVSHKIGGKDMTLDHLENKVVRPEFKDARVHFGLVCGAKGCPPLKNKAFTEKNVQSQLEKNAKAFIPLATKIDGDKVTTSKLFEWFADDFKTAEGSVEKYLAKYLPKHKELFELGTAKIGFSEYSWALNAKPAAKPQAEGKAKTDVKAETPFEK